MYFYRENYEWKKEQFSKFKLDLKMKIKNIYQDEYAPITSIKITSFGNTLLEKVTVGLDQYRI